MKTQSVWSGRHPDDGLWMAYHDHELSPEAHHAVEAHLATCDRCRERVAAITQMAVTIEDRLSVLAPNNFEGLDAHRSLVQIRQSIQHRKEQTMIERLTTSKRTQRWVFGFAALAVVIGLFALEPVRAFASDFLGLFRVEKFVVVDIDPGRMDQIASAIDENMSFGSLETFGDENNTTIVATLDEAAAAAGFTPRTVDGYGDPSIIAVSNGATATFTPDVASMRQVFAALDLDPNLLPDSIDGKTFTFTTEPGVSQAFNDANGEMAFSIMQMPSPTVDGPSDVDLQQLGNAMLQLMGMSPEEAARLSQSIDWTSTFVIPVPRDLASVREVQVNGVTGLLFDARSHNDDAPPSVAVLWQQNGYVFGITAANMSDSDLVELANSLK